MRLRVPAGCLLATLLLAPFPARAAAPRSAPTASYEVRLARIDPPLFHVIATLPVEGELLSMDGTRPGDLPQLLEHGWPALVADLRVSDAAGRPVEVVFTGETSWRLPRRVGETLRLEYTVDLSLLKEKGWPAPREAACVDERTIALVGRALFMAGAGPRPTAVAFNLPAGWNVLGPWAASEKAPQDGRAGGARFEVVDPADLTANLVVLTRDRIEPIRAAGFRLTVVAMGHWRPIEAEVRALLSAHASHFVNLMSFGERGDYMTVLMALPERGGEAYRQSFAATVAAAPAVADRPAWGTLLGHELFHYWNGWRLRGSDYASSQWFQEGVTEYVAGVSTSASGIVPPGWLVDRLSEHVANARRLTTTLGAPGTRKGPPLYSAGALAAFSLDVLIRTATDGDRNLGDFMRTLWKRCDGGTRPYGRDDILAALAATAPGDWAAFHAAHVAGTEPLPPPEVLTRAGLRLMPVEGSAPRLEADPSATAASRRLLRDITRGR